LERRFGQVQLGVMREFLRIVRDSKPTLEDFTSLRAQGRRLRDPAYEREWAEGVSVYDDFERACEVARRYRFRAGSYNVKIMVTEDAGVEFRQTFEDPHHFTIYAEPALVLALVEGTAVLILGASGE
jgi:hypothetical protein